MTPGSERLQFFATVNRLLTATTKTASHRSSGSFRLICLSVIYLFLKPRGADAIGDIIAAADWTGAQRLNFIVVMALCSLPRTNPGNRHQYKRANGPFKLVMVMVAGADNKLPYGNLPRLILAWICTEAGKTRCRST